MAFEHVSMGDITPEFEAWKKAQKAVAQSERALRRLRDYPHAAPHFRVLAATVSIKTGEAVSIGVGHGDMEDEGAATLGPIAERLSADFNKRAAVVCEQVLEELRADAEAKRIRFLQATMRAVAGEPPLPEAEAEECVGA